MITGVANGVVNAVKGGLASTEVADSRIKVCQSCDKYDGTRCKNCGCFMAVKTRIQLEKCPEGKW